MGEPTKCPTRRSSGPNSTTTSPLPPPDWNNFVAFTGRSAIPSFRPSLLPQPHPRESYNDDVAIPFYASAARTYAIKQRQCHHGGKPGELILGGPCQSFPQIPLLPIITNTLPPSLDDALKFVSSYQPEAVKSFWGKQLSRITKLVSDSTQADLSWNKLIPPEIAPAAGKVRLDPLMSLMAQHNLGVHLASTISVRFQADRDSQPTTCLPTLG